MNAYILTLLLASLAAAIVELMAPRGDGGRIAAHVRMIAGLFLLVALLNPLREGLTILRSAAEGGLTDQALSELLPDYTPTDYEATFHATLSAIGADEAEAWVVTALESEFGIPPSGCTVEAVCESDGDAWTLTEVRIALHGKYMLEDPHPIEDYVFEWLGCACYVTVGD